MLFVCLARETGLRTHPKNMSRSITARKRQEKVGYGGHSVPFLGRCNWKDSPPLPLPKAHPASPWSWTLESCFAIFQRSLAQWLCPLFSLCFCKTHLQHDSPGLSLLWAIYPFSLSASTKPTLISPTWSNGELRDCARVVFFFFSPSPWLFVIERFPTYAISIDARLTECSLPEFGRERKNEDGKGGAGGAGKINMQIKK